MQSEPMQTGDLYTAKDIYGEDIFEEVEEDG